MPTIVRFDKHKLIAEVEKNVKAALKLTGKGFVNRIRESMASTEGSSAGSPPGVVSGRLQDSITWASTYGARSRAGGRASPSDGVGKPKVTTGSQSVVIGSNVPYALALELGSKTSRGKKRRVKARPYLWPALRGGKDIIIESFSRV